MSLGDHLRYLRAMNGGQGTDEIAKAIGLDNATQLNLAEVRYRPVDDDHLIESLAAYYARPVAEFQWHNARSRKYLTFYLSQAKEQQSLVSLTLRGEQQLTGRVVWWDLSSVGLRDESGRVLVVQRHAIIDWPNATEHWWAETDGG